MASSWTFALYKSFADHVLRHSLVLPLILLAAMYSDARELAPFKSKAFPLGAVKATGWLQDQLVLSANGLAGHEFDFYRYVAKSTWLGGNFEYSELHESAPYWFNSIVPHAFTLDNPTLKAQAKVFLDYTLKHQAPDGWLGPETTKATRGIGPRSLLCSGLVQYAEADPTETDRIVTALHSFVILVHSMLRADFTGLINQPGDHYDVYGFGVARGHELPMSLQWLYDNHPRNNSEIIWETIELMFEGTRKASLDWTTFFVLGVFPTTEILPRKENMFTHGVNTIEGLRYPTVLYRMTKDKNLPKQTRDAVNMTFQYHGSRSGAVIADEYLGGLSPIRGTETCMAVEMIYSMAYLHRFHGVNDYADKAERAAFNAFPAGMSSDMWAHTYVTQTNQPWSRTLTGDPFFNVGPYGNTFGLEPNYPCCTVNHGQGYPKYVSHSYTLSGDDQIVHALLGPTTLKTEIHGSQVKIDCKTSYPFSGKLKYLIQSDGYFKFSVRVPDWALVSSSSVFQGHFSLLQPVDGLQTFEICSGVTSIEINLDMQIITSERNGTTAVYYGPLLYALDIEQNISSHSPLNYAGGKPLPPNETHPLAHDDVIEPASEWKYAIDPTSLELEQVASSDPEDLPNPIWARGATPTVIWVTAYPIQWPEELGTAALPPKDPVVMGNATRVKLIPYGAAKIHIADFPTVKGRADFPTVKARTR